jgi:hypothetical protein
MAVEGHRERGQVMPALLLVVVFVGAVVIGALRVAVAVASQAHAGDVADAVALAGALGGAAAAEAVAGANGAVLERFEHAGDLAAVWIRMGGARASSRAERVIDEAPGCGDPRRGSAGHPVHCGRAR